MVKRTHENNVFIPLLMVCVCVRVCVDVCTCDFIWFLSTKVDDFIVMVWLLLEIAMKPGVNVAPFVATTAQECLKNKTKP